MRNLHSNAEDGAVYAVNGDGQSSLTRPIVVTVRK